MYILLIILLSFLLAFWFDKSVTGQKVIQIMQMLLDKVISLFKK